MVTEGGWFIHISPSECSQAKWQCTTTYLRLSDAAAFVLDWLETECNLPFSAATFVLFQFLSRVCLLVARCRLVSIVIAGQLPASKVTLPIQYCETGDSFWAQARAECSVLGMVLYVPTPKGEIQKTGFLFISDVIEHTTLAAGLQLDNSPRIAGERFQGKAQWCALLGVDRLRATLPKRRLGGLLAFELDSERTLPCYIVLVCWKAWKGRRRCTFLEC